MIHTLLKNEFRSILCFVEPNWKDIFPINQRFIRMFPVDTRDHANQMIEANVILHVGSCYGAEIEGRIHHPPIRRDRLICLGVQSNTL